MNVKTSLLLFKGADKIGNIYEIVSLLLTLQKDNKELCLDGAFGFRVLYMREKRWAILDAVFLAYFDKMILRLIQHLEVPANFPLILKNSIEKAIQGKANLKCVLNRVFRPLTKLHEAYSIEDCIPYLYKDLIGMLSDEEKNDLKNCADDKVVDMQLELARKLVEILKSNIFTVQAKLYFVNDIPHGEVRKIEIGKGETIIRLLIKNEAKEQPEIYMLYDSEEYTAYTT